MINEQYPSLAQSLQSAQSCELLNDNRSILLWGDVDNAPDKGQTIFINDMYLHVDESVPVNFTDFTRQRVRVKKTTKPQEWVFAGHILQPYLNDAQDWQRLHKRYDNNRKAFAARTVNASIWLFANDFKDWLILNGAEIPRVIPAQERFRFWVNGYVGIIYHGNGGNLFAHDIADMFHSYMQMIGELA